MAKKDLFQHFSGKSLVPGLPDRFPSIVKLIFALLILSSTLAFVPPPSTYAEKTSLTFEINNKSVVEVLDEIERQSEFRFFYDKLVDVDRRVSVKVKDADVFTVLDQIFASSNVNYKVVDRDILLTEREVATSGTPVPQARITVTGRVTDNDGAPITGAYVSVKGSSTGTITDENGGYSISVPNRDAVLSVSFIGYLPTETVVGERTAVDITMDADSRMLDEVVVVGYGTQRKVNLTGAITSIGTEELDDIPASNMSNLLAGRAPGVTVSQTTGLAGGSSNIRMRGSFGEPLFVINNVIKDKSAFDALDPNEVENISFLKDAASASVYGSKAGNGVILVTTKKGQNQKPEFQFKSVFSVSNPTRPLQHYTATDELIWANRVAATKGQPAPYDQEIFDYFADRSYNINDWIWRNPASQKYNISVNGGGERISYYMMLGYHDENGSYRNLDFKKFNFRSDITADITERFSVNFNLSGNQNHYDRWYWPYDNVDNFNVPDFYRATFNWTKLYPFFVDDEGNPTMDTNANPVTPGAWNPVHLMMNGGYQREVRRNLDGQLSFNLDLGDLLDGLKTSVMAQYNAYDMNRKGLAIHNVSYLFQSASTENKYIPAKVNPDQMLIHNLSANYENIQETVALNHSYQFNWFLNYDKVFNDKHAVSALLVYEQAEGQYKALSGRAEDMLTTSIDQIFVTSSDAARRHFDGRESEDARQSFVGRFNYTYADKYIVEFSFRQDGNYKFAPATRWGLFPSASFGWRISEEGFMKNVSWLSNLKLRGSYGSTGDDNNWDGQGLAAFQWRESYATGSGYLFGDDLLSGLQTGNTPNPFISWAKLETYDIGLDFGFFNNRLTGEFDVYYKNKNHILRSRTAVIPSTYGAGMSNENYAKQDWKGFELDLRWSDRRGEFDYSVYANMGYVKDAWRLFDEPVGLEKWRSAIGHPNNRIMGYISEGIIRSQAQLDALPDDFMQFGRKPMLGTILYKDIRGANYSEGPDGKIDSNDETYLSERGVPRINYGVGFSLSWKGIAVDAHFQGVGAYDRMVANMNTGGVFQTSDKPYFNIWTGDVWTPENTDAKYPGVSGEWQEEWGATGSTFYGAYLRLKNLNVGYTLPRKWFSKIGVSSVQIFVNATNLFCISGMPEMDPEQNTLDSYPLMKSFTGGLSINF